MKPKSNTIFVDTSAFKALIDKNDEFHNKAVKILSQIQKNNQALTTNNFILDETYTLIRVKSGLKIAQTFYQWINQSSAALTIHRVNIIDETHAWKYFTKNWSHLSFTDCVCFAQMKRLKIKHTFTFDKHFSRAGFQII